MICNGNSLKKWHLDALTQIEHDHEIVLMVAHGEISPSRKAFKHAAYYALNIVSMRSEETKTRSFPNDTIKANARIDFTVSYDGNWAVLPPEAMDFAISQNLDCIIKFSLGLLRIPPANKMPVPILSFHHGDPRSFRGRPAGFYEISSGTAHMGQIVQILSNKLDAGEILATAQSPVYFYSYKKTLKEAYQLSPYLLPKAIEAFQGGHRIDWSPVGKNYRLPGNWQVAKTILKLEMEKLKRLIYGAFYEKKWHVSTAHRTFDHSNITCQIGTKGSWQDLPIPAGYTFIADPFFYYDRSIIVEALNRVSGQGELVIIGDSETTTLTHESGGHLSYPSIVEQAGERLLLPETAQWCSPHLFAIDGDRLVKRLEIDINAERLLDPTFFEHREHMYIFGNEAAEGPKILRLWVAKEIGQRFKEHPSSPIRISIRGSRMGGQVLRQGDEIIRIGQDQTRSYGDGVILYRIDELSPQNYVESEIQAFSFEDVEGPHTLNFSATQIVFDWYVDRFDWLAGVRRISARLRSK